MLEFILSESKTLLSSVELQTILVKEFQRRFRNEKSIIFLNKVIIISGKQSIILEEMKVL